jgi:hypothetical protein
MKRKLSGYLTIFLSLSLTMLLGVFFFLINSAFINYSKMKLECATDIGMNAVLGEFHRELLEQYDLLFIDLSYGSSSAGIVQLENHLLHFIEGNVRPVPTSVSAWNELELRNATITATLMAHHFNGRILRRQACAYISENTRAELLTDLLSQAQSLDSQDTMSSWTDTMGDVATILASLTEERRQEALATDPHADVDGIEVTIDNPAEENYEAAQRRLDEWESSDNASGNIVLTDYYSHRTAGQNQPSGSYDSSFLNEAATEVLFSDYLFEKMGCYTNLKEGSRLAYQIEYILMGADSDEKNLQKVKQRLFFWRLADNSRLYFSNSAKRAEATAIAAAACAAAASPQLTTVVANAILFGWAYKESNDDVDKLLDGGKVPLVKLSFDSDTGALSYSEYLGLLLFLQNEDKKLARVMDIIEMDIRLTPGNRNFRIDWCLESLQARIDFSDKYGSYAIERRYGYY